MEWRTDLVKILSSIRTLLESSKTTVILDVLGFFENLSIKRSLALSLASTVVFMVFRLRKLVVSDLAPFKK